MSPSYQEIHQQASGKASYHLLPAHLLSILTGPEVVVLLGIADYYRHDTKLCSVGVRELEKTHKFGNRKTIGRCIARLVELGFVEIVEHGSYLGNVSKYRLPWKADGQLPAKAKALLSSQPAPAPPPIISVPPAPAQTPSVVPRKAACPAPVQTPSPYDELLQKVTEVMTQEARTFDSTHSGTTALPGIKSAAKKFLDDSIQKTLPLVVQDLTAQWRAADSEVEYTEEARKEFQRGVHADLLDDWNTEGFAAVKKGITANAKSLGKNAGQGAFISCMSVGVLLN